MENDESLGFQLISTDIIDDLGIPAIVAQIRERVGKKKSLVIWGIVQIHFQIACQGVQLYSVYSLDRDRCDSFFQAL